MARDTSRVSNGWLACLIEQAWARLPADVCEELGTIVFLDSRLPWDEQIRGYGLAGADYVWLSAPRLFVVDDEGALFVVGHELAHVRLHAQELGLMTYATWLSMHRLFDVIDAQSLQTVFQSVAMSKNQDMCNERMQAIEREADAQACAWGFVDTLGDARKRWRR